MEQRVYHGANLSPEGLAEALLAEWDQDQFTAQVFGDQDHQIVQIGQREGGWLSDEPRHALTIEIDRAEGGIEVTMGQQKWARESDIQVFAGGMIGFFPFFFPIPLGRIFGGAGDAGIDQRLPDRVWQSIERYVSNYGAATGPTRRLSTVTCPSCGVANPEGAQFCSACGSNLVVAPPPGYAAQSSAATCPSCGHVNSEGARFCNNCGTPLGASRASGQ